MAYMESSRNLDEPFWLRHESE